MKKIKQYNLNNLIKFIILNFVEKKNKMKMNQKNIMIVKIILENIK